LMAVSKTPSATMLAMPPLFLLLGCLVTEAWHGERWPLAALTGVLAMSLISLAIQRVLRNFDTNPRVLGGAIRQSLWVTGQVVGAVVIAWVVRRQVLVVGPGRLPRFLRMAAVAFTVSVMACLGIVTVRAAWRVTNANDNDLEYMDVGQFARRLP